MKWVKKTSFRVLAFIGIAIPVVFVLFIQFAAVPIVAIPSGSMQPTLRVGDLVFIGKTDPDNVKVGDIIVIRVPEPLTAKYGYPNSIVHRVIRLENNGASKLYRIKGDNNETEDPFTVFPSHIMGKVHSTIPYAGYFILFLHSKQGLTFIVSATALYALYLIVEEWGKRRMTIRRVIQRTVFAEVLDRTQQLEDKVDKQIELLERLLQIYERNTDKQADDKG